MRCPRCLDVDLVRGSLDGFEECPRCRGVAVEPQTLFTACPAVAALDRRALEIQLLGKAGGGIANCPRCRRTPFEFTVILVPIDWCASCGTVWIDGDERPVLDVKDVDPSARQGAGSAYRTDAREAGKRLQRCAACYNLIESTEASFMSSAGLVCKTCQSSIDVGKTHAAIVRAHEQETWQNQLFGWLGAALTHASKSKPFGS